MKYGISVCLSILVLFFQNCTNSLTTTDLSSPSFKSSLSSTAPIDEVISLDPVAHTDKDEVVDATDKYGSKSKILALHYFNGGGFRMYPNWDNDLQIILNRDGSFQVSSKYPDLECYKETRTLTKEESVELKTLISHMHIIFENDEDGPVMLDGGVNQIEIVWYNGKSQVIELDLNYGLINYQRASNGKEIAAFLKRIDNSLFTVCQ